MYWEEGEGWWLLDGWGLEMAIFEAESKLRAQKIAQKMLIEREGDLLVRERGVPELEVYLYVLKHLFQ